MKISVSVSDLKISKDVVFSSSTYLRLVKQKRKYKVEVKEDLDVIDLIFRFINNLFGTEYRNIAKVLNSPVGQARLKQVQKPEVRANLEEINTRIEKLNKKILVRKIPLIKIPSYEGSSTPRTRRSASPSPTSRSSRSSSKESNELLIPFYLNSGQNAEKRTLKKMWKFSLDEKESIHNYIQWLFPTDNNSDHNPTAPLLDPTLIKNLMKTPELFIPKLEKSLDVMLVFFGLEWNDTHKVIQKSASFNDRAKVWLKKDHHNHLRITRILESLHLFGLNKENQILFACLKGLKDEFPDKISKKTWEDHWTVQATKAEKELSN